MSILKEKKNIIFDLGNVVVDINLTITTKRFKEMGFTQDGDFLSKYKQSGIFCDFEEGKIDSHGFTSEIQKLMNNDVSHEKIIDAWNAIIGGFKKERIETILKLKENHRIFLLSNTNEAHIEACANKVPIVGSLDKLFDKTYYSYKMGMSKPNNNIFEALLTDAGIKAEETLFLDDAPANIEAAQKLGIESWLVEHPDQWVPKMNELMK